MTSTLDNPAWHALNGPQREFAQWSNDGVVAQYPRGVAAFCAVDAFDDDTWQHLQSHFGHRAVVTVRSGRRTAPAGWKELFVEPLSQYVAEAPEPEPELETVDLGPADIDDMLALTEATEPGPFLRRTHELGHYIGVHRDGVLVAMAGERLRTNEFSEISAVCVAESARRQGLAGALTTKLVHEIRGRGSEAMLHVRDGNEAAHELYRRIGFRKRTELTVGIWRWIGHDD